MGKNGSNALRVDAYFYTNGGGKSPFSKDSSQIKIYQIRKQTAKKKSEQHYTLNGIGFRANTKRYPVLYEHLSWGENFRGRRGAGSLR